MISKLFFFRIPQRRSLILRTLSLSPSNFSVLADCNNVANSDASSQNLFLHFVTTRFNISSADAAKMLKWTPSLGRLKTLDGAEQFVSMLNRHGYNEDQTVKIFRCQPSLLLTSAERLLEPKIQLLKDYNIGGENLIKYVTLLPRILGIKLEVLRSRLELLKIVFPTQDLLIRAIRRYPFVLAMNVQKTFKASVAFWEGFGFRGTELTMFLLVNPRSLQRTSFSPGQLDLIRRIDIPKESKLYKHFVSAVASSRLEVLEARIHNLELCGLSPEQALQVFRAIPRVLTLSEENIKKKMGFMLNNMELTVDFVVKHPRMLTMSLDKLMRPRFLILQNMTAIDGAGEVNPTRLYRMLMMTEAKFVAQIIQGHPEAATLWSAYRNAISNVSDRLKRKELLVS